MKENCGILSVRVYVVMIKYFGKCGCFDDVVDLFNEMKKFGCIFDVYVYNVFMFGLVRGGMINEV